MGGVAVADEHDVPQRQIGTDGLDVPGEVLGEHGVDEHDLCPGVRQDELKLLARQAKVERVDDPGAQESGVIQLQVLVTVARHHRESVGVAQTELTGHGVGQAQHPIGVGGERGTIVAVAHAHFRRPALHGREEQPVEHELLHGCAGPWTRVNTAWFGDAILVRSIGIAPRLKRRLGALPVSGAPLPPEPATPAHTREH